MRGQGSFAALFGQRQNRSAAELGGFLVVVLVVDSSGTRGSPL